MFSGQQYQSVNELVQLKNIRINNRRVSVKLDLGTMPPLEGYTEFGDLKLWFFGPTLLKGTGRSVLKIEAGLGKPAKVWGETIANRLDIHAQFIEQANQEFYQSFSFDSYQKRLGDHESGLIQQYGEFLTHYQDSWDRFKRLHFERQRIELSLENGSYRDHPEDYFFTQLDQGMRIFSEKYLELSKEQTQYQKQCLSQRRSGSANLRKMGFTEGH